MSADTTQLPFSAKSQSRSAPPVKRSSAREREYLRPSEVEAMISAARSVGRHGVRDAAMILLMFRHGLSPSDTLRERTAELVALKWSQVDFSGGYIEIRRVKHGHDTVHPLRAPELRALRQLKRDYPDTPYVFVSERKAPLSTRSVRQIIARAGLLAKIPFPVHPHQLRHACGYYLASSGQDTRAIQDYLGHKNIHHTVRYTQMSPQRFENFWRD
ncbi:integrase family protein (plasmid) [Crinalium epipsammum PCC 9333]|uniref:Integrase family protein n=1 Tax=Crinalium epipsammum PCC 9333 TaxID=1173022 RepID=K9W6A9_9CYAN|nr:tyrosine-type recombinase/integrase [Crinalium epipsammum]AFZ15711.1 integrase family protein [Crinalium epipsammum PCC 9333]